MATTSASLQLEGLTIDAPFCTKNGSKVALLKVGGESFAIIPEQPMRNPFDAGTFDKDPTARLNLNLIVDDPGLLEELQRFDERVKRYLQEHSEEIFKRPMSAEAIEMGYTPMLRPPKEGTAYQQYMLRCKVDVDDGKHGVCCWSEKGERARLPESWAGLLIVPNLHFSHVWLMGAQFGVVVRLTDAKILSGGRGPRTNPFAVQTDGRGLDDLPCVEREELYCR